MLLWQVFHQLFVTLEYFGLLGWLNLLSVCLIALDTMMGCSVLMLSCLPGRKVVYAVGCTLLFPWFSMDHRDPKLFNWNVRGLNSAARWEAVKLMIQQVWPKVVCLQRQN